MATDFHLQIGDIKGESTHDKHKEWIDVLSFSWGATQQGTMEFGGGGGAGKVSYQDFHFTMLINKATPKLIEACSTGEHFPKAIFSARKAGKEQHEYLKITFSDVIVTSYQTGGGSGSEIPTESVSLGFSKVEVEYKEQKADGSLGGTVKTGYDLKALKKI
jgi:type VI secretion system secreted protein Hcp